MTAEGPDRARSLAASPAGRRLLFAGLYFAEGAPIGFIWWAVPVWLRTEGATPGEIARLMAWVTWPWALKFLWAPLVDLVQTPRFGLRAWVLLSQLAMGLTIAPLGFLGASDLSVLLGLLLAHGLAAATQDAAIDTLALRTIDPGERGAINGWMQVGMLGARALFGGGAVLVLARVGHGAIVALLVLAILGTAVIALLGAREPPRAAVPTRERLGTYAGAFGSMLRRRRLWGGLLVATLVGAGFEGLASLAGPLLLDHGADTDTVGLFFLLPTVALMGLGAVLGGRASDRFGRVRVTAVCEAATALAVVAVGACAWSVPPPGGHVPLLALLCLVYLGAGAATASLYGLLMALTDRTVAATQFCTFMAGINLCYVWSTRTLGSLVDRYGYGPGFVALGAVSLASLPLLLLLRGEREGRPASAP